MAQTEKFASVFAAHPDAQEIYVVDGMPFLKSGDARNYAGKDGKVETVKRPAAKEVAKDSDDKKKTGKKAGK